MTALSTYINLFMHRAPSWHWKYYYSHFTDKFFNILVVSSISTPSRPRKYYSRGTNVRGFSWEIPHLSLRPFTIDTCFSLMLISVSDPPSDQNAFSISSSFSALILSRNPGIFLSFSYTGSFPLYLNSEGHL